MAQLKKLYMAGRLEDLEKMTTIPEAGHRNMKM